MFEPHKSDDGIFHIGHIAEPAAGSGHANFPNQGVDPNLGGVPCNTALGSVWIGSECQRAGTITDLGQRCASVRKLSESEYLRLLGARGLDNLICRSLLKNYPAATMRMINNSPSQPILDRSVCQLLRNMSRLQSDGFSAWERWSKANEKVEARIDLVTVTAEVSLTQESAGKLREETHAVYSKEEFSTGKSEPSSAAEEVVECANSKCHEGGLPSWVRKAHAVWTSLWEGGLREVQARAGHRISDEASGARSRLPASKAQVDDTTQPTGVVREASTGKGGTEKYPKDLHTGARSGRPPGRRVTPEITKQT